MSTAKSFVVCAAAVLTIAGLATWRMHSRVLGHFTVDVADRNFVADGRTPILLQAKPIDGHVAPERVRVQILEGRASVDSAKIENGTVLIRVRPGVLPGKIAVEIAADDFVAARSEINTALLTSDAISDGTPDFLRLGADDEAAFRNWFTYLAESQYYRPPARLPREISDCAALIRFAYREALRAHDARWANDLDLDDVVFLPAVGKYQYPYTPLGAALFRIHDGAFRLNNLTDGTFAQFADAETLRRFNTHLVSRNLAAALPGDLLFFQQIDQSMPFHTMVFVGRSHFESDSVPRLVYHTGPIGQTSGEIRRPTLATLLQHPEPKWRPVPGNNNFLGVYRWNILR